MLSFEWTLLAALVVIGIVSGVAAARDAIIDELGDSAAALMAFDQSYSFAGLPALGLPASQYTDTLGVLTSCGRGGPAGEPPQDDSTDGG